MTLRIALGINDLAVRGGTHKQMLRLADSLRRAGAEVQILTFDYQPEQTYPEFGNFAIENIACPQEGHLVRRLLTRRRAALQLVDKIHPATKILSLHDQGLEFVALAALKRFPGMKIAWQINDLSPAYRVGPFRDRPNHWRLPIHRAISRYVAKRVDAITVNVSKNQDLVRRHMGAQARVFYCGVDQIGERVLLRPLQSPLRLLSTGVFFPYRNYEAILQSMIILRDQGIPSSLVLVGATQYAEEYAERIRTLASQERLDVRIAGQVDDDEFRGILEQAHLFIFANLDQSWGLAVFEAMTMSLPIVLSSTVGAVELLGNVPGVFCVDARNPSQIANAVKKITVDQNTYDDLSRKVFDAASPMTWDNLYCRDMAALFHELAEKEKR